MSSEQLETRVVPQSLLELLLLLLESKFFARYVDEETFAFRAAVSRGHILRQAAYLEIIVPRSSAKWRIISIVIALISTQNCAAAARV